MTIEQLHDNQGYQQTSDFYKRLFMRMYKDLSEMDRSKFWKQIYDQYDAICLEYDRHLQFEWYEATPYEFISKLLDCNDMKKAYTNFILGKIAHPCTTNTFEFVCQYEIDDIPFLKLFKVHSKDMPFPTVVMLSMYEETEDGRRKLAISPSVKSI